MRIFEHNLRAAKCALKMLKEKSKACIIHSTGTGKSYIALYIIQNFKNKKIGYFAPNVYILNQTKELFKSCGIDMENIVLMTYMSLSNQLLKSNNTLNFDLIIFDEFHRCGANYYEKGVKKLLEINDKAKVFGMTATPIRTLDKSRDMAEELFEGNIASVLSLSEAIARKILPKPRYVVGMYTYEDELTKFKTKVKRINKVSDVNEKVNELIEQLENAKGLETIFKENITEVNGKYIVFTKSITHLYKVKEELIERLKIVNKNIHSYVVHSKNSTSNKEFKTFKEDSSDSLKLLFVVDMLNEGFHLESISGVILLRPTKSFRIFNQQIGRAFQAGISNSSVILDLVNNFDNITMTRYIQAERESNYFKTFFEKSALLDISFTVVDEIRQIQELFEQAYFEITVTKQEKINLLLKFRDEFKRDPKKREEYKNVKIGYFLEGIRLGKILLSDDEKELLKNADICISKGVNEKRIHSKVLLLSEFYEVFKREPYSTEVYKGVNIGSFLRTIKRSETVITNEDKELLIKKGLNISSKALIVRPKVKLLVEFYSIFKRDPHGREIYKGIKLWPFLSSIRRGELVLNELELEALSKAGIRLNNLSEEEQIHQKVLLLIEFNKNFKRDPKDGEKLNNINLYSFLRGIRSGKVLLKEDRKLLENQGIRLTLFDNSDKKQKKVLLLKEFYEEFNRKPKKREVYKGELIGEFDRNIRRGKVKLNDKQKEILKAYI